MKALALVAALMVMAAVPASPAFGQQKNLRARGISARYDDGSVDGLRVVVLKSEGGTFQPVDPSQQFKKGDEIKIAFESNFDGYVYIVNVTPAGKKKVLFPHSDMANNMVTAHQRYELPTGGVMFFDSEKGVEVLQVVMSREPIALYDDAVKTADGSIGETATSAAAELASDSKAGIVLSNVKSTVLPGLRARGLELAPGSDKSATLIANPDKSTKQAKLGKNELAMFEIRLKHV